MATITFDSFRALSVFNRMLDNRLEVTADDDNDTQQANALRGLSINLPARVNFGATPEDPPYPVTIELSEEHAEAARDVLWHCLLNSSSLLNSTAVAPDSPDHIFPGQVMVDPEEAPDPLVAQIPLTEKEAKILATLLMNATMDDHSELTADVATDLLEKLRQAVFR